MSCQRTRRLALSFACLLLAALSACSNTSNDDALTIYATTGYLADAARNIAPEADITTMVGPEGDPHTYQPSTRDIERLQSADLVLWNGLHLEAQMIDQLKSLGDRQIAVGDLVDSSLLLDWPETDADGKPLHDPHIWNSPEAWSQAVERIGQKLETIDPDNAETYRANTETYRGEIASAAIEASTLLADVASPRILITGHDAFGYFGQTFNFEVHATDFISTEAKLSAGELSSLATLIAKEHVPVIFADNQASPQAITSLREAVAARGWSVRIADEPLYADTLGATEGVDTYLGAFLHNARTVATELSEPADG